MPTQAILNNLNHPLQPSNQNMELVGSSSMLDKEIYSKRSTVPTAINKVIPIPIPTPIEQ